LEGDDPGCHRDRAERHQHIDCQRSGVTLGKRLETVGFLRSTLSPLVPDGALFLPVEGPLRPDRVRVRPYARKTGFLVSFGATARIIWLTDVLAPGFQALRSRDGASRNRERRSREDQKCHRF
jgi:hypothetical protein